MSHWNRVGNASIVAFGVVLPAVALVTELTTRMSAGAFFDPLPTVFHALLVAFVAVANCWAWLVLMREKFAHFRWAAGANGFAIGIAAVYSVLFLPLLPLGTIGIIFFGLGILVWAPLASLIVALRLRVRMRRAAGERSGSFRTWPGVVLGVLALVAVEMPATITRVAVRMATDSSADARARGMSLLRTFGSEDVLLRMCYVRSGNTTDMISFFVDLHRPPQTDDARALYYRVTGRAFNSVPAPVDVHRRAGELFSFGEFDADQGAEGVGGRLEGLWLASSRLDGSVSADAALGYLEWTMVFRNSSPLQREARAQIALPPGAVVSRVTLWINGEEREAAFAGRRQVKEAYRAVVRASRDPVLVTSAGPDRISMQLFPVPPSGEMKVRVGMTMPLMLANLREGVLSLPYFHERNFDIRKDLRHSAWIESKTKLQGMTAASFAEADSGTIRADLADARLATADASIVVPRSGRNFAWAPDARGDGQLVRQVIDEDLTVSRPRRLVIVADGSVSMRSAAEQVAKALAGVPEEMNVRLVFAHDEGGSAEERLPVSGADLAKRINAFDYDGGHDNTPALARGLDIAFERPDSVLLWIHGPQPVLLETEEALLQRLSRGPQLSKWYELQVAPGPNRVLEKLDGITRIETLRNEDLERLVAGWRSGEKRVNVRRERVTADASALPANELTSDHLVRLWASDEIGRLIQGGEEQRVAAIQLAQRYQLVTPVSGAVVLETQQQYDAAGLQPVPEGTVPTIPEPEEWALILVALLVLGYVVRKQVACGRGLHRRHARVPVRAQ